MTVKIILTADDNARIVETSSQSVTVIERVQEAPNLIITAEDGARVIETSSQPLAVIERVSEPPSIIITAGQQGPAGRDAMKVSSKPLNRINIEPDGLYVKDDLTPDPLAYYILARS